MPYQLRFTAARLSTRGNLVLQAGRSIKITLPAGSTGDLSTSEQLHQALLLVLARLAFHAHPAPLARSILTQCVIPFTPMIWAPPEVGAGCLVAIPVPASLTGASESYWGSQRSNWGVEYGAVDKTAPAVRVSLHGYNVATILLFGTDKHDEHGVVLTIQTVLRSCSNATAHGIRESGRPPGALEDGPGIGPPMHSVFKVVLPYALTQWKNKLTLAPSELEEPLYWQVDPDWTTGVVHLGEKFRLLVGRRSSQNFSDWCSYTAKLAQVFLPRDLESLGGGTTNDIQECLDEVVQEVRPGKVDKLDGLIRYALAFDAVPPVADAQGVKPQESALARTGSNEECGIYLHTR
ncbi:hypothetical protein HYDPIDRAFT_168889 [Hydnomerulius pinastri MD-312]|uniref:Unplaced genomic scaffold scaffold_19, whole genome shotgun sequence n=1 Tax=Hydnomerulius pinastri MD-312 TaxID=994086 RepID=A0A0C9WE14_9AGAM|nr:hypothetical protein HYDPIDRAFT_168889 [Hydnomerulius pinastri MD-312]